MRYNSWIHYIHEFILLDFPLARRIERKYYFVFIYQHIEEWIVNDIVLIVRIIWKHIDEKKEKRRKKKFSFDPENFS
jgi:hypothetical protein